LVFALMINRLFISMSLALGLLFAITSWADERHNGHSDDLLLLLKDKIKLQKLIKQYPDAASEQKKQIRVTQRALFKRALPRLKRYVAVPESQYPNMAMYHESLQSRAALMQDFADLMAQSQCLQDQTCQTEHSAH